MAWQRVQLFDFGPAINRALLVTNNTFPTDTVEIAEASLASTWIGGLPGNLDSSGLPALEWLYSAMMQRRQQRNGMIKRMDV